MLCIVYICVVLIKIDIIQYGMNVKCLHVDFLQSQACSPGLHPAEPHRRTPAAEFCQDHRLKSCLTLSVS